MIVHFDGDLLVYRCGFACEDSPVEHALHAVKLCVESTLQNLGCSEDELRMYISGKDNFRNGVATIKVYKGNRLNAPRPKHGPAIREYLMEQWDGNMSENEEADDVVGYSHYGMYLQDPHSSVICSVDKDLDMIPGMHYNFVKDHSYYVTDEEGDRWFYQQLLMGDSTDNIPGLPGIGPAKAGKMLAPFDNVIDYYKVAREAYKEAYEDGDAALLENAHLLWIRRHPNEWWAPPYADED